MFRIAARTIVNQSVRRASSVEIPEGAMAFSFSSPFEQYFDHDVTIKQARLLVFSSLKKTNFSHKRLLLRLKALVYLLVTLKG